MSFLFDYYCNSSLLESLIEIEIFTDFFVFQIATEGLRIEISPGISQHMAKLIRICMNEDPGKRPSFDQVITVLEKMKKTSN